MSRLYTDLRREIELGLITFEVGSEDAPTVEDPKRSSESLKEEWDGIVTNLRQAIADAKEDVSKVMIS